MKNTEIGKELRRLVEDTCFSESERTAIIEAAGIVASHRDAKYKQQLGVIAALTDDAPKEICTTVDAVRWLRDRYRDGQKALRELDKIRTEKLAVRELTDEATAVSAARVYLSNEQSHL